MATTTNYGWVTPDDTALVKDGAAAIRTLGSSADTTTKNLNPSTTLGDIEFRSSTANVNTRLGIGGTGTVLTVAAGVPSWAAPAASGMTFLATANLTGTATSISSIDQTYNHLFCVVTGFESGTNGVLALCNPKSGGSAIVFGFMETFINGTTVTNRQQRTSPQIANDIQSNTRVDAYIWFYNYSESSRIRHFALNSRTESTSIGNGARWQTGTSITTGAIDEIEITANGSTMSAGTIRVYGVK